MLAALKLLIATANRGQIPGATILAARVAIAKAEGGT
jgi:hypothetical protein